MPRSRRKLILLGILIPVGIILLVIGLVTGLLMYAQSRALANLSQSQQTSFGRWMNEPANVPDSALVPSSFSEETLACVDKFRMQWEAMNRQAAVESMEELGAALNTDLGAAIPASTLECWEPARLCFVETIQQPDYLLGVWTADRPNVAAHQSQSDLVQFQIAIQGSAKAQQARVLAEFQDGNREDTLAELHVLFRSARCRPFSSLIEKLCGSTILDWGLDTAEYILEETDDPQLRAGVYQVLHENWEPLQGIRFDKAYDPSIFDPVALVRAAREQGIDIEVPEDATGRDWMDAASEAQIAILEEVRIPNAQDGTRRQLLEQELAAWRSNQGLLSIVQKKTSAARLYSITAPQMVRIQAQIEAVFVRYRGLIDDRE
ncbi:hypothetical protein KQI84_19285 [bacterium]|nr:hypothetical protein [bacterium]